MSQLQKHRVRSRADIYPGNICNSRSAVFVLLRIIVERLILFAMLIECLGPSQTCVFLGS